MLLILLMTATAGKPTRSTTVAIVGELVSIPTLWFSGPWVSGPLLRSLDTSKALPFYAVTLALCFGATAIPLLFRLIIRVSNQVAGDPRRR